MKCNDKRLTVTALALGALGSPLAWADDAGKARGACDL